MCKRCLFGLLLHLNFRLVESVSLAIFPAHRAVKFFMICFGLEYLASEKLNSFKGNSKRKHKVQWKMKVEKSKTKTAN